MIFIGKEEREGDSSLFSIGDFLMKGGKSFAKKLLLFIGLTKF